MSIVPSARLPPLGDSADAVPKRPSRILQFGAGNFLRGFVDQMVQEANDSGVCDLGITVVKATPRPDAAYDQLREQRGMFHVVLEGMREGSRVERVSLVSSVQRVISAYDDPHQYRSAYLDPDLQIVVSNTTEAGLVWTPDNLDAKPPATFPGKITALLADRWHIFGGDPSAGLDLVPCELVADNGQLLRDLVRRHAREHDLPADFLSWLDRSCVFHDSLVDRIVPGFPLDRAEALMARWGTRDEVLVVGEEYAQWAIAGTDRLRERLPLDRAGLPVLYVDNVRPYRETKVRLLNGAHTALAAVAIVLGCETVREAITRPDLLAFTRALLEGEALPTLAGDPDHARAFADAVLERFANPALEHFLGDITLNSLAKWRARGLPVVLDCWTANRSAPREVLALTCILLRYAGAAAADGPGIVDDDRVIAAIGQAYVPTDARRWVGTAIDSLGWSADLGHAATSRLVEEVSAQVERISVIGLAGLVGELA